MKKFYYLFFLLLLGGRTYATTYSGASGNITWNLNTETGILTLAGSGAMNNYSFQFLFDSSYHTSAPWDTYRSKIQKVVVNQGVTSIGSSAFGGCSSLTSITIPESVTSIGDRVFYGCSSLTSITIPDGVTSIGELAFYGCSNLTSITLPEGVTSIGENAFYGCSSLASISVAQGNPQYDSRGNCNAIIETASNTLIVGCKNTIVPEGVTSIGKQAFTQCYSLTSITIPEGVTSIGYGAFSQCYSLTSITIPEGVTSIGDYAFSYCSLASITIPEGVTSIGIKAFYDCLSLTSITIPEGVTSIGEYAFDGCSSLASITIPEGVTSIGIEAFYGCSSLTSITMKSSSPCTLSNSYVFPSSNKGFKIYVPYGSGESYKSAKGWSDYADYIVESQSITGTDGNIDWSLDLTNGVLTLNGTGTMKLYDAEFGTKTGPQGNEYYGGTTTAPWGEYYSLIKEVVVNTGISNIGKSAFFGCDNVTSITLPESVTRIEIDAFSYCSSLTSITLPKSVSSIRTGAFSYCNRLTAIALPQNLTSIESCTFEGCNRLTSILLPKGVTSIGDFAFRYCTNLTSITIPEGVTSIGKEAFSSCNSLSSIILPESLTNVGENAFSGCNGLEEVTINSANVGNWFSINASIGTVTLGEKVTSIGKYAFRDFSSLSSITIPENVTSIGYGAFVGCSSLTSITLPNSVTSIGDCAFQACVNLASITLPESLTSIGMQTFYWCSSLISLTIPESVTSIGSSAFYCCSNLTSITFPESVTSIGNQAFYDCSSLTSITMNAPSPCTLSTYSVFPSSNEGFMIYVPYGSGESYKSAEGWSDYADYIVEMEMEEEPADDEPGDDDNPGTPTPELLPITNLSEYDYALYFPETEVNTDVEVVIPLNLKNAEENITAFQCDIYLPEGVKWASSIDKRGNEILTQPAFNADADRTDANYHTITPVTRMSNGAYRVMCYSMSKEIFLDNDGAVLDIPVVIPEDMEDGDYNLIIKDIFITDTDTEQHEVEEVVSKLTVVGYTLGDPNADGLINITDIVSVISYILEEAPANFTFKAADVNGDGIINITDIVAIIDIILSDEAPASTQRIRRPAFGSAPTGLTSLEIVPFGIDAGTTSATVTLDLLNPNDEFTAFECDIVLPDGIGWEYTTDRRGNIIYTQPTFNADADRTDANYHTLSNIKKMEDGSFKVMCYSMAKEIFLDEAGAILNLPLTFSPELAEGIYEIEVANTVLTRTDVTDKKIGSYRASVVVGTPDAKTAVIYGDVNATAVAMINERLAGCGTLDLRGALAVDGNTAFTLNDNAVIFVADGMSIKNEKNVVEDGTCAVLTLTDGVAFTPSESFTAESASYGRTLGKDEYGTLVLPFEPNAATKAAYAFYELSEADGSTLTFDETTTPEAGTPYVIVSKDAATTFAGSGTVAITAGDAAADGWTMKGTYETLVFTDATELASLYCLSGNQFKQATSKLTMNPFRAYFQGSGSVGSITLRGSDGTTRILSETLQPAGDCYDLTGRRVLNAEKGIYIVNGKKVLK